MREARIGIGEDSVAMISRTFRRALAQLPKLRRESVIHAESLGELLRHIFTVRAARAQIHFLEDTEVRMRFPHGGRDSFEVLAAVDIPVEDHCARAGWGVCRIGNRQCQDGRAGAEHQTSGASFSELAGKRKRSRLCFILEGS